MRTATARVMTTSSDAQALGMMARKGDGPSQYLIRSLNTGVLRPVDSPLDPNNQQASFNATNAATHPRTTSSHFEGVF